MSEKKVRNKAGYKETDRKCALCNKDIAIDKALARHHVCYEPETIVSLHWGCHELVHARCKYHNHYLKTYGKDFGPIVMAFDLLKMYKPYMDLFHKKYPQFKENLND